MQSLFKFSDYDIFAYIVAGLTLMIGADVVLGTEIILRRDGNLSVAEGAVRVLGAYVLGLLLTDLASGVLQRGLEHHVIGQPFGSLMRGGATPGWWRAWLFGSYHTPASSNLRARVKDRLEAQGWTPGQIQTLEAFPRSVLVTREWLEAAENVFSATHPAALRDSVAADRMERFVKLYGFCRNLAFILLLCAAGFLWLSIEGTGPAQIGGRASSGSGAVTVLVVPADGTAARVSDAMKPPTPKTCAPFAESPSATGCGALPANRWMALGMLLIAFLMFRQYLYFHRLYALEVLTGFSREKKPEPAQPPQGPAELVLSTVAAFIASGQAAVAAPPPAVPPAPRAPPAAP